MTESTDSDKKNDSNWTEKRVHNTSYFRSAAILGALAIAGGYSWSKDTASHAEASVHLLAFGTGLGTMGYTTFVLGITMYKNLSKRQFGMLQSHLFPKYFAVCSSTLVIQMSTLQGLALAFTDKSMIALSTALILSLLNQFYLEPKATENMFARYKLEDTTGDDTEQYKALKSKFGLLHGLSSLANLVAFCASIAHGVFLASALVSKPDSA